MLLGKGSTLDSSIRAHKKKNTNKTSEKEFTETMTFVFM